MWPAAHCGWGAWPQKRLNLTKTVRKLPVSGALERKGRYMEDKAHPEPKYDEEHAVGLEWEAQLHLLGIGSMCPQHKNP